MESVLCRTVVRVFGPQATEDHVRQFCAEAGLRLEHFDLSAVKRKLDEVDGTEIANLTGSALVLINILKERRKSELGRIEKQLRELQKEKQRVKQEYTPVINELQQRLKVMNEKHESMLAWSTMHGLDSLPDNALFHIANGIEFDQFEVFCTLKGAFRRVCNNADYWRFRAKALLPPRFATYVCDKKNNLRTTYKEMITTGLSVDQNELFLQFHFEIATGVDLIWTWEQDMQQLHVFNFEGTLVGLHTLNTVALDRATPRASSPSLKFFLFEAGQNTLCWDVENNTVQRYDGVCRSVTDTGRVFTPSFIFSPDASFAVLSPLSAEEMFPRLEFHMRKEDGGFKYHAKLDDHSRSATSILVRDDCIQLWKKQRKRIVQYPVSVPFKGESFELGGRILKQANWYSFDKRMHLEYHDGAWKIVADEANPSGGGNR